MKGDLYSVVPNNWRNAYRKIWEVEKQCIQPYFSSATLSPDETRVFRSELPPELTGTHHHYRSALGKLAEVIGGHFRVAEITSSTVADLNNGIRSFLESLYVLPKGTLDKPVVTERDVNIGQFIEHGIETGKILTYGPQNIQDYLQRQKVQFDREMIGYNFDNGLFLPYENLGKLHLPLVAFTLLNYALQDTGNKFKGMDSQRLLRRYQETEGWFVDEAMNTTRAFTDFESMRMFRRIEEENPDFYGLSVFGSELLHRRYFNMQNFGIIPMGIITHLSGTLPFKAIATIDAVYHPIKFGFPEEGFITPRLSILVWSGEWAKKEDSEKVARAFKTPIREMEDTDSDFAEYRKAIDRRDFIATPGSEETLGKLKRREIDFSIIMKRN